MNMVGVAQLVELRIVVPVVVGSIPIAHPIYPFTPRALVAQLDRASDSGSEGREFESRRAHHLEPGT